MLDLFEKVLQNTFPFLSHFQIYLDCGTTTTRIAVKEKGVVLKEPTCLALNTQTHGFVFFGTEAKNIIGKTPEFLKIVRPLVGGIVSDFDAEVGLLKKFVEKSISPYMSQYVLVKPPIQGYALYPVIATEIEQKAVEEVALKVQCSQVHLVKKPLATAAGCGLNIFSHNPSLIVDMGGGLIEISIVSGGGIVINRTLKNAGEHMDKLIANYVYLKHGIVLGDATCERLKTECFHLGKDEKIMLVRGKSLENGLPKSVKVKTSDIREALYNNFIQITDTVKELIEISPPEVVEEIYETGMYVTGGLASIEGIEGFFSQELNIEVYRPPHFQDASIYGLTLLDKNKDYMYKVIQYSHS